MKVKNLLLGIVVVVAIGIIIYFAMKISKEIKDNSVNTMNAVEVQSEEVVEDASNTIEESNTINNSENEENLVNEVNTENGVKEENTTETNETEDKKIKTPCDCGCGRKNDSCCEGDSTDC